MLLVSLLEKLLYIDIFWANFEPKIEWAPNVFWGGSEEVKCSLPRGKSHGEDGTSKPFMGEWEVDIVFGFNINFLDKVLLNFFNKKLLWEFNLILNSNFGFLSGFLKFVIVEI